MRQKQQRRRFLRAVGSIGVASSTAMIAGCLGEDGGTGLEEDDGEYPTEDIRSIVGFGAGGGTDLIQRQMADLADAEFYHENIEGAAGSVGWEELVTSEPDGYTISMVSPNLLTFPHTGVSDVGPDDVIPIMQPNFDGASLAVHEDSEFESVDELVEYAEDGNTITISNAGPGSSWHVAAGGFAYNAGIVDAVEHVPYDGGAPAAEAVASGEVDATAASLAEVYPVSTEQDDSVQPLAVMDSERNEELFPDVPTLQEEGYDWEWGAFRIWVVPDETPDDRVQILEEQFTEVYESEEFEEFMLDNGFGMVHRGSEEAREYMEEMAEDVEPVLDTIDVD